MHRKFASFLQMVTLLLVILPVAATCQVTPITISGGYQLDISSSVALHTLFGPPMAYNSTPVPLVSYDFGTGSGPINVGDANSIFSRLGTVTLPTIGSSATVQVLQLAFTNITDQAAPYSGFSPTATGSGHVVASVSPTYVPLGTETITRTFDTGGTFTLTYKDKIDFRTLDGTLLSTSPILNITSMDGTWQSDPPPGSLVIPGVNDNNFFVTHITLMNSLGNMRSETTAAAAAVPEPSSVTLLVGFGVMGAGFFGRRKNARKVA